MSRGVFRILALLGLLALAVGSWRSFPRPNSDAPVAAPLRVVLFDVSAGTTRRREAFGLTIRRMLHEEARAAEERGEELGVGLYGADSRHLGIEPAAEWVSRLEGREGRSLHLELESEAALGSELDTCLALFERELTSGTRPSAELVLVVEAGYTGVDPAPRLRRLESAGVRLRWRDPPPASLPDLAVEGIELPPARAPGVALVARVDLALHSAGRDPASLPEASLRVFQQDVDGTRQWDLSLRLPVARVDPDGYARWSIPVELGATPETGFVTRIVARLIAPGALRGGDPIPENDSLVAHGRVGEALLGLAYAGDARRAELEAWLAREPRRWPGIEWRVVDAHGLVEGLDGADLLVTLDVSPRELPRRAISDFVRAGGGWFFAGGWRSLGGWEGSAGLEREVLARLLPLTPAPPQAPPRDVILLVDGSGSMAGEPFEAVKRALVELVLVAEERDTLHLRFFTAVLGDSLRLDTADSDAQQVLRNLLATRVPGGQTAILYSLESLVSERVGAKRPSLVFLLSDGQDSNDFNTEERGAGIAAALSAGASRFVVLGMGSQLDAEFLQYLVPPGGALRTLEDLDELTEVFQSEILGERVLEGEIATRLAGPGELEPTPDLLEAWRDWRGRLPLHDRALRCVPRPGADLLMISATDGEALMAWQRVGAGRVAAWASGVQSGWAQDWAAAETFFAPLFRFLAAGPSRGEGLSAVLRGGRLQLSGVPVDWPIEFLAEMRAMILPTGLDPFIREAPLCELTVAPDSVAPGSDPRRSRSADSPAELDAHPVGAPVRLSFFDSEGELLGVTRLNLEVPAEFAAGQRRLAPWPWQAGAASGSSARVEDLRHGDLLAWVWILVGILAIAAAAALDGRGGGARADS